jgi:hypothetical protein
MDECRDTRQTDPRTDGGWAILEIMGHKKMAGFCRTVEAFGATLLEITTPAVETEQGPRTSSTHLFGPSAIFCLTWTTEETARLVTTRFHYDPVERWELPGISRRDEDDHLRLSHIGQYRQVNDDVEDEQEPEEDCVREGTVFCDVHQVIHAFEATVVQDEPNELPF